MQWKPWFDPPLLLSNGTCAIAAAFHQPGAGPLAPSLGSGPSTVNQSALQELKQQVPEHLKLLTRVVRC